jgi:predicted transport protein
MSDIKLFRIEGKIAKEIHGTASTLEKPLQSLIEANLEPLLGIRLVATEYSTGKTHAGRIDTLGLDENDSPVIFEYKRSSHENIINQGLFYLDWLMDHKAEFKLLVLENFGKAAADRIDWSSPRLVCIAADFTKYDTHAVQQMDRNIELVRYRQFGKDPGSSPGQGLLLLELVNAAASAVGPNARKPRAMKGQKSGDKPVVEWLRDLTPEVRDLFASLERYVTSLGDDVQRKDLKLYVAFRRLRNFATVAFQRKNLIVNLHLTPDAQNLIEGFTRDVSEIGHWGTGDLQATVGNVRDLERVKPLLLKAYEGGSRAE